jgi:RNase adaptor protein for sRNA GlmZ degradation
MAHSPDQPDLTVAVVGPCTSGKSTLVHALRDLGYQARMPAQEHSYIPDMWRRLARPDVLIYLDVSWDAARTRRQIAWGPERIADESKRLAHARIHADLYLDTDNLSVEEVRQRVLVFLTDKARP